MFEDQPRTTIDPNELARSSGILVETDLYRNAQGEIDTVETVFTPDGPVTFGVDRLLEAAREVAEDLQSQNR